MEFIYNLIFIIIFVGMLFIGSKLIIESNFPKLFKQGKTNAIRVASIIVVFIVAFLVALCFKELMTVIYNLLN